MILFYNSLLNQKKHDNKSLFLLKKEWITHTIGVLSTIVKFYGISTTKINNG